MSEPYSAPIPACPNLECREFLCPVWESESPICSNCEAPLRNLDEIQLETGGTQ